MKHPSSFRDPSGYVFEENGYIMRAIHECHRRHWDTAVQSGLLDIAQQREYIVAFSETVTDSTVWKILRTQRIPFISYPYEWSFTQLQAAALLTLDLHMLALNHGMILKDASAFNVQFYNAKPIFIDLLSFEIWKEASPWPAYRQFCQHFLAPLLLMRYVDLRFGMLSKIFINGIDLDFTSKLLPMKTYFSSGIFMHIHLHAKVQKKYADIGLSVEKVRSAKCSKSAMENIVNSLRDIIVNLNLPRIKTEWSDYYIDTNYTDEDANVKAAYVEKLCLAAAKRDIALDVGANTGRYSEILSKFYATVIAADIDPVAVDRHMRQLQERQTKINILPLVLDFVNSTPALGWACQERASFHERVEADCITALAIIHHLYFTSGIPFKNQAEFFSSLLGRSGCLILEFIQKSDAQVQRMIAAREMSLFDYSEEAMRHAFAEYFVEETCIALPDSSRMLYLMRKKYD